MRHFRKRHNAKARRTSCPAKRSKRGLDSERIVSENNDPNVQIHVPKSKEQKDLERRERTRQELIEQQVNSKITSKKKRRLEKYIDKKLKKEERVQILEKLAQSQAQIPTILHLQPSATLGSRKSQTYECLLAKKEDKEVRRLLEGEVRLKRHRRRLPFPETDAGDDDEIEPTRASDDTDELLDAEMPGSSSSTPITVLDTDTTSRKPAQKATPSLLEITIGSALRKMADGAIEDSRVVKRRQKGPRSAFRGRRNGAKTNTTGLDDLSENSFDSSDSACDTSADEDQTREVSDHALDTEEISNDNGEDPEASQSCAEDYEELPMKRKRGGFKDWAIQQLSTTKGYVAPSANEEFNDTLPSLLMDPKKRSKDANGDQKLCGPLGEELHLPSTALAQHLRPTRSDSSAPVREPSRFVTINRLEEVQMARLDLPILAEEQPIVEAVRMHPVVIICGETGSGKTTQLPQFLYEAGFGCPQSDNPGMIGITQPRRVAAMSMAARVGHELSLPSTQVAYQVRYDATISPSTVIKFMTDGVLLRELAKDFTLSRYSAIIIDEAHERSVNTDILIGVLSRVIRLREQFWKEGKEGAKPLRLVIMSATLRVSDFAENPTLFPTPPPVLRIEARQHPVAIHFARRTRADYVSEAVKKASKIHTRLPPGGILIFLTGQNEIIGACKKLEARYGEGSILKRKKRQRHMGRGLNEDDETNDQNRMSIVSPAIADVEVEEMDFGSPDQDGEDIDDHDANVELDPEALDTDEEEEEIKALGIDFEESRVPMHILPLYSMLPTEKQMRVFQPAPEDSRLVIVATNVAETSLTISGIRYVIDCGRAKERCYDPLTGVQSFRVSWISKASADQRAGRAGRTGPGHCYRLYSSALFENHFEQFVHPEILRMPIEGIVLQMKNMSIDKVTNFPFPTSPNRAGLHKTEVLLNRLGALTSPKALSDPQSSLVDGHITELGKSMALFPLPPRFSRMLVSGRPHDCLPYVIAVVAALSVGDPFLREDELQLNSAEDLSIRNDSTGDDDMNRIQRRAFFISREVHSRLGNGKSDIFRLLSVVGAYEYAGGGQEFCREHFVRPKVMEEIHKLRAQISNIMSVNFPGTDVGLTHRLKPPSDVQLKIIRQLLCAAFIDQVAVRRDLVQATTLSGNRYSSAQGVSYRALGINADTFIHPSSVLWGKSPPDFIVFQEAVQSNQLWLNNITVVNPAWLSILGKQSMCTYSKPVKSTSGELMVIPRFGPEAWELPAVQLQSISGS